MSSQDWRVVHIVVYPPGADAGVRIEETVRVPRSAGFEELLATLALSAPDVYAHVRSCIEHPLSEGHGERRSAASLETLCHYFALGGPIVCPSVAREPTDMPAQTS